MLHAHRIRTFLFTGLSIYALRNLDALDINRSHAERRLHTHRPADTHGNRFKCKYLPKCPDVKPCLAGCPRIGIIVFRFQCSLHFLIFLCPVCKTLAPIIRPLVTLHKYLLSHILQTVSDFPFDAHIRNFPVSVLIFTRHISVQRISIRVRVVHHHQYFKIDFVCKCSHYSFPPSLSSFLPIIFLRCS